MLKDYCTVCDHADDDFIGIKFIDGHPHISFPRGYSISKSDELVRQDILGLIAVLHKFSNQSDGESRANDGDNQTSLPILSFQYIIYDFLAHGYYLEREIEHKQTDHGKINWKRTIQQIQPQVDNDSLVYLNFVTRRSINKSSELTRIHEYCVYESFAKLGWLYISTRYMPRKPSICFNRNRFLSILNNALNSTFNTEKKQLLSCMIAIVNSIDQKTSSNNFYYGTTKFEYVWENLIDYVFGESNKSLYFPHAKWHIIQGNLSESSPLRPDTIMRVDGKLFILDAKYYKFGITGLAKDLPATSSIQKQITYGDYISARQYADKSQIFNAFVMPYKAEPAGNPLKFVSIGTADWINYSQVTENYKYVLGILLDTRYIMNNYIRHNSKEILRMSKLISDSLMVYRSMNDAT